MDESKLSVAEVTERMQEALRAKRLKDSEPVPRTSDSFNGRSVETPSQTDGKSEEAAIMLNGQSGEILNKLHQLEVEVIENNRRYHVVTDWAITSRRKGIGPLIVLAKKVIRQCFHWYIDPPIAKQREFNSSVTKSINFLKDFAEIVADDLNQIRAKINELDTRVEAGKKQRDELRGELRNRIEKKQMEAWRKELESRVEANNIWIEAIRSRVEGGEEQMAAWKTGLENRVEASHIWVEATNRRIEAIDSQLERDKQELEKLENQVRASSLWIEATNRRIEFSRQQLEEWKNGVAGQLGEAVDSRTAAQQSVEQTRENLTRRLEGELTIVADRMRRIERRINKGLGLDRKAPTVERLVEEDKQEIADIDYFLFESRFRGTRADIKRRQHVYLEYFKGKQNVLDIGCGRGEFVELLLENGTGAVGIDINQDMVDHCQDLGLPVSRRDLFEYLNSLADQSLDGIFSAQVIEHMTSPALLHLIRLAYTKLKPTGVIALETINPQNLVAVANWFYMDLSHIRPVHPLTLQFVMEAEGFKNARILYLNPTWEQKIPELHIDGAHSNLPEFNQAIDRVNHLLFGPLDYAVVGIR